MRPDLDDGDGDGEDDGAEGLSHAGTHHLGMVNGGEHGAAEEHQLSTAQQQRVLLRQEAREIGHDQQQPETSGKTIVHHGFLLRDCGLPMSISCR